MTVIPNNHDIDGPPTMGQAGWRAGNYEILEEIGSGGMSRVYRGRRLSDGENVAIKVIHINNAAPDYEARLLREPEVQQGIGHENIVRLYESFREREEIFLAMEYVDGRSLARIIRQESGPMPFERARVYFRQVLRGVDHLHRLGIVHRDIKPSNILIDRNDTVKLADFGIAKFKWEGDKTATRMGLGTPEYMSPEQVSGVGSDHRSDIYALGITLFEMLTGRRPFSHEGSTPMAYVKVIQDVLNNPLPDPRAYQPGIPAGAVELIAKATAKNPQDRYQNVDEMVRALLAVPEIDDAPATVAFGALGVTAPRAAVDTDATTVLSQEPAPAVAGVYDVYEEEPLPAERSARRLVIFSVAAALLLAAIVGYAAIHRNDQSVEVATAETTTQAAPADLRTAADDASSRYAHYLFDCQSDSLTTLYASETRSYLGRDGATRESIGREFERSCEQSASIQGVNVVVDSVAAVSATEMVSRWRIASERRFKDGSIVLDSAIDLVHMVKSGSRWVIVSQDRLWGRTHIYEQTPTTSTSSSTRRSRRTSSMPEGYDTGMEGPIEETTGVQSGVSMPEETRGVQLPSGTSGTSSGTQTGTGTGTGTGTSNDTKSGSGAQQGTQQGAQQGTQSGTTSGQTSGAQSGSTSSGSSTNGTVSTPRRQPAEQVTPAGPQEPTYGPKQK